MLVLLSVVSECMCTHVQIIQYTVCIVQGHKCLHFSRTHLLHTDSNLSRLILELFIDRGDLDFIKYIVNKLSVDVEGELYYVKYLELKPTDPQTRTHTHTHPHAHTHACMNTHTHTHIVVRSPDESVCAICMQSGPSN